MSSRFRWAKTLSVATLLAYFFCIFGHGLGEAIAFAFSNQGQPMEITLGTQGDLQTDRAHEHETQHAGLHAHDANELPAHNHADQNSILCENEATAIHSSGFQPVFPGLQAITSFKLLLSVTKAQVLLPQFSSTFAFCDANLRRLNSVLLRV